MSTTAAPKSTPPHDIGGSSSTPSKTSANIPDASQQRSTFLVMALNMSWKLAVVVLVPVIGGVELDKALHTKQLWTFVGLGVALVASALVMWQAMQAANRLPVPKLTDEQRQAIQKQYEEEDDE